MTIPTMMNCEHQGEGWCLVCVTKLARERDEAREAVMLEERRARVVAERERDEARASLAAEKELREAAEAVADSARGFVQTATTAAEIAMAAHADTLAVLRRLREAAVANNLDPTPQRLREWHEARDAADAFLARHATPPGPSRVSDGLPVTCPVCGRTTETRTNGVCRECWEDQHDEAVRLDALVETYPCGCRGTPGNRCPIHSCP